MTYLKDNNATTRHVFWRSKRAQERKRKAGPAAAERNGIRQEAILQLTTIKRYAQLIMKIPGRLTNKVSLYDC